VLLSHIQRCFCLCVCVCVCVLFWCVSAGANLSGHALCFYRTHCTVLFPFFLFFGGLCLSAYANLLGHALEEWCVCVYVCASVCVSILSHPLCCFLVCVCVFISRRI